MFFFKYKSTLIQNWNKKAMFSPLKYLATFTGLSNRLCFQLNENGLSEEITSQISFIPHKK